MGLKSLIFSFIFLHFPITFSIKWFFYKDLVLNLSFVLSSSYCGIWFVIGLLRSGVFHLLVVTLYLCGG